MTLYLINRYTALVHLTEIREQLHHFCNHQYYIIKAYKLLAERTVKRSKLRKDNILRCVCLCHAA